MLNPIKSIVLIFILSFGLSAYSQASGLQIEFPENANSAWVSNKLNQNGMVLSIRTFHSPDPVEDVLGFYRTAWFKAGDIPGFIESDMAEWKLISQKHEAENVVLQLKSTEQGGSTGFLSIAQLNSNSKPVSLDFPLPDNTEEFATTFLEEDGAEVHTMTFITKQTVGTTSSFYEDRLTRKGWAVARNSEMNGTRILLFNRKGDRCEMVIQKLNDEDTVIFVNRVQRDA